SDPRTRSSRMERPSGRPSLGVGALTRAERLLLSAVRDCRSQNGGSRSILLTLTKHSLITFSALSLWLVSSSSCAMTERYVPAVQKIDRHFRAGRLPFPS